LQNDEEINLTNLNTIEEEEKDDEWFDKEVERRLKEKLEKKKLKRKLRKEINILQNLPVENHPLGNVEDSVSQTTHVTRRQREKRLC